MVRFLRSQLLRCCIVLIGLLVPIAPPAVAAPQSPGIWLMIAAGDCNWTPDAGYPLQERRNEREDLSAVYAINSQDRMRLLADDVVAVVPRLASVSLLVRKSDQTPPKYQLFDAVRQRVVARNLPGAGFTALSPDGREIAGLTSTEVSSSYYDWSLTILSLQTGSMRTFRLEERVIEKRNFRLLGWGKAGLYRQEVPLRWGLDGIDFVTILHPRTSNQQLLLADPQGDGEFFGQPYAVHALRDVAVGALQGSAVPSGLFVAMPSLGRRWHIDDAPLIYGPISISPDGRLVAYVVVSDRQPSAYDTVADVRFYSIRTGRPVQTILSKMYLYSGWAKTYEETETDLSQQVFQWSPDSQYLLVLAASKPITFTYSGEFVYPLQAQIIRTRDGKHIATIPIPAKQQVYLANNLQLYFFSRNQQQLLTLDRLNITTNQRHQITTFDAHCGGFIESPSQ
jgi:hypothetical protein